MELFHDMFDVAEPKEIALWICKRNRKQFEHLEVIPKRKGYWSP